MAKFCTKCGKPIGEGGICDCETVNESQRVEQQVPVTPILQASSYAQAPQATPYAQAPQAAPYAQAPQAAPVYQTYAQPAQAASGNFSIYLKKLFQIFKGILRFPSSEGSKFAVSEDRNTALGLIGVQAIFTTLFAMITISHTLSVLFGAFGGSGSSSSLKMPYVQIFFVTLIASFALSCAFAGIIFGISYLFKNKISYTAALCITAVRSVIIIPVTIIAVVLLFLNLGYGLMLFYAGGLAGLCYMVAAFPCTSTENKNKVPLIIFLSLLAFAIVSYFVMIKCLPFYLPSTLKDISKELSNPSKFFSNFMNNF